MLDYSVDFDACEEDVLNIFKGTYDTFEVIKSEEMVELHKRITPLDWTRAHVYKILKSGIYQLSLYLGPEHYEELEFKTLEEARTAWVDFSNQFNLKGDTRPHEDLQKGEPCAALVEALFDGTYDRHEEIELLGLSQLYKQVSPATQACLRLCLDEGRYSADLYFNEIFYKSWNEKELHDIRSEWVKICNSFNH